MLSADFPIYTHLDALNSLVTKCVHALCFPVNSHFAKATDLSLSSLFDYNLLKKFNCRVRSKAPTRCLEILYEKFNKQSVDKSMLDIGSRQAIIDYVIREHIQISSNFIIQLLKDGGMYNLDLWQLCEINEFTLNEVDQILVQMSMCSTVFRSLSIGGSSWFYNFCVSSGPLKKLLCKSGSLPNLKSLKLQAIPLEFEFISVLYSCPILERLEISQPSLNNRDIFKMSFYMATNSLPISRTLRHVTMPSSVKEEGLLHFLAHFTNITHLRCTPFEQLLDLLDMSSNNLCASQYLVYRTQSVLSNLRSISIAHPMSCDMIDRLVKACPKIEGLTLEVQEGMNLMKLVTDTPNLSKLVLHNSSSMPLNFVEHIVPLLEGCGNQLVSLSLENFDHIDLTTCAQYCPNLRSFSAQWFSTLTLQPRLYRRLYIKSKPFSHLEHLRIRPRPHQSLTAEICSFLLNDAIQLRHIELYCCSELTDDAIIEINQRNPLQWLQTFIVRHGHNVTNEALCRLVSQASSTDNLVFHDCGLMPPIRKEDT
ncbi:hypothetical protein RDWZM_001116 [Blomia tropicalis]|uniref:Uncharacterized protein n=1 Tax=Blomia tropicalis TaxID=40697 RepID=A0A9Q0MB12_BLOTA|nr:hypothetical protein RDWZM_001116 [Blomia tropicalis]